MAGYRRSGARRSTSRSRRSTGRTRSTGRSSFTVTRRAQRRNRAASARPQVVRLEIVQTAPNPVARPEIGVMPASAPRKAQF